MPFFFSPCHLPALNTPGPAPSSALPGLAVEWLEIRIFVYLRGLNLLNQAIPKIALLLQHRNDFLQMAKRHDFVL